MCLIVTKLDVSVPCFRIFLRIQCIEMSDKICISLSNSLKSFRSTNLLVIPYSIYKILDIFVEKDRKLNYPLFWWWILFVVWNIYHKTWCSEETLLWLKKAKRHRQIFSCMIYVLLLKWLFCCWRFLPFKWIYHLAFIPYLWKFVSTFSIWL